ncbi:hypothetical protein FRB90_006599 [Tulasnella sp. 427]|nr:hypothetical protein FRB90_006599 [Tulasnella sp. 427]
MPKKLFSVQQRPTPPTKVRFLPRTLLISAKALPNILTLNDAVYNEDETPPASADPCVADISVYHDRVTAELRQQYEGDSKKPTRGPVYYNPGSDEIPSNKKLLLKAKRRFKLCQKPTIFHDKNGHKAVIYVPHDSSRNHHLEALGSAIDGLEAAVHASTTKRGDFA